MYSNFCQIHYLQLQLTLLLTASMRGEDLVFWLVVEQRFFELGLGSVARSIQHLVLALLGNEPLEVTHDFVAPDHDSLDLFLAEEPFGPCG